MASTVERAFLGTPIPAGGFGVTPTPFQFVLTGEDVLRISSFTSEADVRIVVQGRILRPGDTNVQAFAFEHSPETLAIKATDHALGKCVLLNLVARSLNARLEPGECFVRVDVVRGTGATVPLGTLLSGYIGSWGGLAWPGTALQSPWDGPGIVRVVLSGAGALGTAVNLNVPDGLRWRLLSVEATFVTNANVATRTPFLRLRQFTTSCFVSESSRACLASTSSTHAWGAGMTSQPGAAGVLGIGGFPADYYAAARGADNNFLTIDAINMDPNDQFTSFRVCAEQTLNPTSADTV